MFWLVGKLAARSRRGSQRPLLLIAVRVCYRTPQLSVRPRRFLSGSETVIVTKRLVDIDLVSGHLRENVHDINNALFVTKGFVEELAHEIHSDGFMGPEFDREGFRDMFEAIVRNVAKLDRCIQGLRDFAKAGIFREPFTDCGGDGAGVNSSTGNDHPQPDTAKE